MTGRLYSCAADGYVATRARRRGRGRGAAGLRAVPHAPRPRARAAAPAPAPAPPPPLTRASARAASADRSSSKPNALRDSSNAMRASQTPRKSPLTRSMARRQENPASAFSIIDELPDELLMHALSQLASSESVPGSEPDEPTFREGADAVVVGAASRAARLWQNAALVSRRWRALAAATPPWVALRALEEDDDINWETLVKQDEKEAGSKCWAASSTTREEGKQDKWHTVRTPNGDKTVVLVRKCSEEGVSYDIVRWVGCLQGMQHPCIAGLQVVRASHDTKRGTRIHAGFEHVDTSLQEIVYATLDRTSHTKIGRALSPLTLKSVLYQLLSALACSHARGVPHGNVAPYRVLARTLDKEKGEYLIKLADFGFSPPAAALCNEELPIRPSRASPELHQDHKRKRYGPANDLWALGTVFAEVACGNRDPQVYMMIQELETTSEAAFAHNLPMLTTEARDLLRRIMKMEPTDRITAADALCHPYFDGIHDECPVVARYLPESRPPPPRFLDLRAPKAWAPGQKFLKNQTELNAKMWTILFDWLSVVSHKFKFVPRSLQLACEFMRRYMATATVARKRLQLIGIGALCLACKHEEVMIPNMNDFIFICDNAYTLDELMQIEVDILTTLDMQLNLPTAHDMMLPLLVKLDEAPAYPDGLDQSRLRSWCECLTLLGLAQYNVALHDMGSLARCVATLGGLLSQGVYDHVTNADGSASPGSTTGKLAGRVCWLTPGDDWACLAELVRAVELALKDQREMLLKCHPEMVGMKGMQYLLDQYARPPARRSGHLKAKDVRQLVDKHYGVDACREMDLYDDGSHMEDNFLKKRAYLRGTNGSSQHVRAARRAPPCPPPHAAARPREPLPPRQVFSIMVVTCALGKQLLLEHEQDAA